MNLNNNFNRRNGLFIFVQFEKSSWLEHFLIVQRIVHQFQFLKMQQKGKELMVLHLLDHINHSNCLTSKILQDSRSIQHLQVKLSLGLHTYQASSRSSNRSRTQSNLDSSRQTEHSLNVQKVHHECIEQLGGILVDQRFLDQSNSFEQSHHQQHNNIEDKEKVSCTHTHSHRYKNKYDFDQYNKRQGKGWNNKCTYSNRTLLYTYNGNTVREYVKTKDVHLQ